MGGHVLGPAAALMLCFLVVPGAPAAAQGTVATPEEAAVLESVQRLFDIMATRDTAAARELLLADGRFVVVRPGPAGDAEQVGLMSHEDFIGLLARGSEPLLERMWSAEVRIHGPIAMVWTPYDFYRGGEFSHCGVDAFTMVRLQGEWRIAGATYTIETEGCPPSPLGPPFPDAEAR
jgi:hypothetical protein